jgi:hypothetical protein
MGQNGDDANRNEDPRPVNGDQGVSESAAGGAGSGASGMEGEEESGAGYGNNAGEQGGVADVGGKKDPAENEDIGDFA